LGIILHIYTGQGKGKTTAAVGLALRAKSRGLKVLFAQFMKDTNGGELELMKLLSITVRRFTEVKSPLFHPEVTKTQIKQALQKALEELKQLCPLHDIIILDEFNCLFKEGILTTKTALQFLNSIPAGKDVVLTGRGAPEELIEQAHYVTIMQQKKHPSSMGIGARAGIEY